VVGGGTRRPDREVVTALLDPAFDPTREVQLDEGRELPPREARGSARFLEDRPDRVRIEATLDGDGYLVLLDSYDPNWRATVDGRPVVLRRANLAFRAVELPSGRHVVEFSYRPWALILGLAVAVTSLGTALVAWRRTGARPR
jgi:uncharacterized membrane protein YfhO